MDIVFQSFQIRGRVGKRRLMVVAVELEMGFFTLTDILRKLTAQNPGLKKRLEEAEALKAWDTAVGPQIAKHAVATRVENGVLYVEVDHSIWKTELHHRKSQILDRLNAGLGERKLIQDLFLVDPKRRRF